MQKSLSEHIRYLATEDGLRRICQLAGYNTALCWDALVKLTNIEKAKCWDAWDIAYATAKEMVRVRYEDDPSIYDDIAKRDELEMSLGESLMVEQGYTPPHFTAIGECLRCGPVLVSEAKRGEKFLKCPWCEYFGRLGIGEESDDPFC